MDTAALRHNFTMGILGNPLWLISPDAGRQVQAIARDPARFAGILQARGKSVPSIAHWDDQDAHYSPRKPRLDLRDGVSVISVSGPIYGHQTFLTEIMAMMLGGCWVSWIREQLDASLGSQDVKSILFIWDSPGGQEIGISELAETIRAGSLVKPVASYVPFMCCSAAYWLASATGEIAAHKSAVLGSIGSYGVVIDDTKRQEMEGVIENYVVAEQSPDKLPDINTDAGRLLYQEETNSFCDIFISSVAEFRGVDEATILDDFGRGWVMRAEEAKRVGMIDAVSNQETVLKKLAGPNRGKLAKARPVPQIDAVSNLASTSLIDQDNNLIGGTLWESPSEGLEVARTIPSVS